MGIRNKSKPKIAAKRILASILIISQAIPILASQGVLDTESTESMAEQQNIAHNHLIEENIYSDIKVTANVFTDWLVTIPKRVGLTNQHQNGSGLYTGSIKVTAEGDIGHSDVIQVYSDTVVGLNDESQYSNQIIGDIQLTTTEFTRDMLANGQIAEAYHQVQAELVPGDWKGTIPFYININKLYELHNIPVESVDIDNNPLEAKSTVIQGDIKEQILQGLYQSGMIDEGEELLVSNKDIQINKTKIQVNKNAQNLLLTEIPLTSLLGNINPDNYTIIDLESEYYDEIAKATFTMESISTPGDAIIIMHETDTEWDYLGTEIVNNTNTIQINLKESEPISIIEKPADEIEEIHIHSYRERVSQEATCFNTGTLLMECSSTNCLKSYAFPIQPSHNLKQVEKRDENGELINKYYECTNCDYSILNLTKLFSGEEISHTCDAYLVSKYDETYHWDECSVPNCGTIHNKVKHTTQTTGYNYGYKSCYAANTRTTYCTQCGYSKTFSDSHASLSGWKNSRDQFTHFRNCNSCGGWAVSARCTKSDGTLITCSNLGTCSVCKTSYTSSNTKHYVTNTNGKCNACGKTVFTSVTVSVTYSSDRKYAYITFTLKGSGLSGASGLTTSPWNNGSIKGASYSVTQNNSTTYQYKYTITQNSAMKTPYTVAPTLNINAGGKTTYVYVHSDKILYEQTAPTINEPTQSDTESSNGWVTQKQISFSGTENHCSVVYLTLTDESGNIYFENDATNVVNKNWEYSCMPNIEASDEERTFILIAKDTMGNTSSKTFTISKTDRKPPTPISPDETSTEWSQTKDLTFAATEEGSGNVQIAFNNVNEYVPMTQNNTTYTKTYEFSGDVYGETVAAIYYKDAIGNTTTQFIKVHNLDNTAPVIVNTTVNNGTIEIEANDINTELGLEGSGIAGYAITWTSAQPQDTDYQESNIITVPRSGTYYVWVKDKVGNISTPVKLRVIK